MYNSPIEVIYQDIQCRLEEEIVKACQNINVNINKEELFKALQFDRDQYQRGYYDGLNRRDEDKWIPCSERLPEEYEVLCCNIYKEMIVGYPYIDKGSDTGFNAESEDTLLCDCIAWMPLPEPYKKED